MFKHAVGRNFLVAQKLEHLLVDVDSFLSESGERDTCHGVSDKLIQCLLAVRERLAGGQHLVQLVRELFLGGLGRLGLI